MRAAALGLVLAGLLAPGVARAQAEEAPPEGAVADEAEAEDPTVVEARAFFAQGREFAEANRYGEAAAAFARSLALVDRPSTLFNLALSYFALGRHVETVAALEGYLASSEPTEEDAASRAEAQRMLALARSAVAHLELEVLPADAAVTVDGEAVEGDATRSVPVDEGTHVVRVEAEGHAPELLSIEATRGARVRQAVRLTSTRVPARVSVEAEAPDAVIMVDGREVGTGAAELPLDAGTHTLRITFGEELPPVERTLELAWSERLRLIVAPIVAPQGSVWEEPALWGIVGGLVVAAGLGVLIGVLADQDPEPGGGSTGVVLMPRPGTLPGTPP